MALKAHSAVPSLCADEREVNQHLDRLLHSDLLRRSGSLSHLLRYLVAKTIQGEADLLKETVIALDVFHRADGFDSRLDNIVRVHAHRLRKVLDAWYQGEGAEELLRFSIPKGNYALQIHRRDEFPEMADPGVEQVKAPAIPVFGPAAPRRRIAAAAALAVGLFLGAAATVAGLWFSGRMARPEARATVASERLLQLPLAALWKSIFRAGTNCVVSFTNPAFLWTDTPKARLYITYDGPLDAPTGAEVKMPSGDPALDRRLAGAGPFYFSDSWTGVGEAMAVHRMTELATDAGFPLRIIRGRDLNYADMRGSNVIFLGSPWGNEMEGKFDIGMTPFRCVGHGKIVANDVKPGEPAAFYSELNPATKELTASYALFSVLPGVSPGTKIVSSAGINTYGTTAALDFMTSANGLRQVMRRFGTLDRQTLPDYFQVVIRTEIIRGDAANATVAAVRAIQAKN